MKFIRVLKAAKVIEKETYDYKGHIISVCELEHNSEYEHYNYFTAFIKENGIPLNIEGKTKEEVLKAAVKFFNHKKFDEMPKKIS